MALVAAHPMNVQSDWDLGSSLWFEQFFAHWQGTLLGWVEAKWMSGPKVSWLSTVL